MKKWIEERFNIFPLAACIVFILAFAIVTASCVGKSTAGATVGQGDVFWLPIMFGVVPMVMGFMAKK